MPREVNAGGKGVQSQPQQNIIFEAILSYVQSCLKKKWKKINTVFISLHIDLPPFICQQFYNTTLYECATII